MKAATDRGGCPQDRNFDMNYLSDIIATGLPIGANASLALAQAADPARGERVFDRVDVIIAAPQEISGFISSQC